MIGEYHLLSSRAKRAACSDLPAKRRPAWRGPFEPTQL